MINLPTPLAKVMQSEDLAGLKPFAVLLRNKWYATEESASGIEESDSGSDTGGYFALDTDNPIDISGMIVKPNTLSMTLDVNEVAQYKANNVTLTLYDPFNRFIENTPLSFFPQGYQLYGSQVVVYYGLDETNRTPLFVGVIKELPTHKPEQYQVDLKLISPLELLRDKEAKEFSDKYYGEVLTFKEYDDNNNPIYQTSNTGVGGFYAIYANGQKMFEGVDYELSQINELGLPALVTIVNADLHSAEITADYYCWKTALTVEQIVSGLVALAGYTENTDIRSVVWKTGLVKNIETLDVEFAIGFTKDNLNYNFNWYNVNTWDYIRLSMGFYYTSLQRKSIFPNNFTINFNFKTVRTSPSVNINDYYIIADDVLSASSSASGIQDIRPVNGYMFYIYQSEANQPFKLYLLRYENGTMVSYSLEYEGNYREFGGIQVKNNVIYFFDIEGSLICSSDLFFTPITEGILCKAQNQYIEVSNMIFSPDVSNFIINQDAERYNKAVIRSKVFDKGVDGFWGALSAQFEDLTDLSFQAKYSSSNNNNNNFENWFNIDLEQDVGDDKRYAIFAIEFTNNNVGGTKVLEPYITYYSGGLKLELVNLSNKSVLDALEDFALISGYEFGIDRQGTFFFRPRSQSTTPIYDLDKNEIVKIDNVQKRFNDFFTKLTLTFAERPLEFYANTGARPTPVDRYGVINKEIDKPEIVNYDNPELAQAIGPQLLAIYSNLADIIQLTGKLNLSLELGDVVNVKRNYNLTNPETASDTTKFNNQNTYFRACKITGLNYNFAKRQITYTLRDVSNETNKPQYQFDEFVYDFQVPLGVKE